MEATKRERSANFNLAEVQLLISLVEKHKLIIENKKTDAATNRDKENAWRKVEHAFNSCGITNSIRTWKTLKLKYEGLKKITKKKSSTHRQELYRTGGGPSNAPEFSDIEEKVLSICSNIKGLEARYDSDTIPMPEVYPVVPIVETYEEPTLLCSTTETLEQQETKQSDTEAAVIIPDTDNSTIFEVVDDDNSQKENKWNKWHPKALKTSIHNVLKPAASKASVASKLDKLSEARLELVQLQMEASRKELEFKEEEHRLKMLHLANDERRKNEIHALLIEKLKCGIIPNNIMI